MTDLDGQHQQLAIAAVAEDAEVAGPHSPLTGAADQLPCPQGVGLLGQEVNSRLDPPATRRVQLVQLTDGGRREPDLG